MTVDDPDLVDGMDTTWSPDLIADYVAKYCKQKAATDGAVHKIDIIMTFDNQGISSHPNHIALYYGVNQLMEKRLVDVEVMTLNTVNIFRKYIGLNDVNFVMPDEWHAFRLNVFEAYRSLAIHATQMVWFRKLFIIFSRYTYVNSFTRYLQMRQPAAVVTEDDGKLIIDEDAGHSSRTKVAND